MRRANNITWKTCFIVTRHASKQHTLCHHIGDIYITQSSVNTNVHTRRAPTFLCRVCSNFMAPVCPVNTSKTYIHEHDREHGHEKRPRRAVRRTDAVRQSIRHFSRAEPLLEWRMDCFGVNAQMHDSLCDFQLCDSNSPSQR